jgi:MFS family permease
LLWIGSTIGFLGMEAADIGYPLAVLALTGSPALAGLLGVVQTLALLVLVGPAGVLLDRYDRRRILLAAEAGRAIVAVAFALHRLTFVHLLGVAVALGAGAAFGAPARMLVVRAVVPADRLTAALTQEEVRNGTAALVGPPLGGALYGLAPALPFLFSAVALAASWACVLLVRIPRGGRRAAVGRPTGIGAGSSPPPSPCSASARLWARRRRPCCCGTSTRRGRY